MANELQSSSILGRGRKISRLAVLGMTAAFMAMPPANAEDLAGHLRVTAAASDLNEMWMALADAFEAAHPGVTVELDNSTRSYDDLVQSTLRDSLVGSLPDVSFQGANRLRPFTDRDLAVPLKQFLEKDDSASRKEISPAVTSIGETNGDTYAFGFGVAVPTIFYNVDLLKAAGYADAGLPSGWNEITDIAGKITDLGNDNLGIVFQYDSADFLWDALLFSQGATMMNADETEIAFDGPEGLKAMEILKSLGATGQAKVDMSKDQARSLFAAGKLGMIVDSNSNLPRFEEASQSHFELATGRFPLPAENGKLPAAGAIAVMFAKDSKQQELAWEFMKFAVGQEGQKLVATKSGWLPANDYAVRNSKELSQLFDSNPHYKSSIDSVPVLKGWYAFPGENSVKITQAIVDHMREVLTQKAEPKASLEALAAEVKAMLPN